MQARKDFVARQPMGRLGTVDDITGILVFLASDESLFATGNDVFDRWGNDDMKLCRYGKNGFEKPGMIDAEGRLRDLSKVDRQHRPERDLAARAEDAVARSSPRRCRWCNGSPRFGVPYVGIGKFVAIGLNYSDHAKEAGLPIPSEPIVFMKATTCISGPNDDVIQPKQLDQARLGGRARRRHRHQGAVRDAKPRRSSTSPATASSTTSPSARSRWRPRQWDKGKGFDTSGPIGPWLVTTDEITDPQNLDMWLDVNGKRMQTRQHAHHDLRRARRSSRTSAST